ncbi:TIGR03936 family radical SAM-associated protein [Chloroflexota bacterium]
MRIRIVFEKKQEMRYTGHLDLQRAWERTLRRAQLPLAYSKGYNPRPRINLASPLPLGFTGEREILDLWLEEQLAISEIKTRISNSLPPGLAINRVGEADQREPALQTQLEASEYVITFLEPVDDLESQINRLLNSSSIQRIRRGKSYDLRPLILKLELIPNEEIQRQKIFTRLTAKAGANGRPEEVASALDVPPQNIRVHRVELIISGTQLQQASNTW